MMARASCLRLRHRLATIAASMDLDLRSEADRDIAHGVLHGDLRHAASAAELRRAAGLPASANPRQAAAILIERTIRRCIGGRPL